MCRGASVSGGRHRSGGRPPGSLERRCAARKPFFGCVSANFAEKTCAHASCSATGSSCLTAAGKDAVVLLLVRLKKAGIGGSGPDGGLPSGARRPTSGSLTSGLSPGAVPAPGGPPKRKRAPHRRTIDKVSAPPTAPPARTPRSRTARGGRGAGCRRRSRRSGAARRRAARSRPPAAGPPR